MPKRHQVSCQRWSVMLTIVWLVSLCGSSSVAAPTLDYMFPSGGMRGSTVTVECSGEFTWPANVWAPGLSVTATDEKGKLRISIPDDLATDRVWIRIYDEKGISSALPFLIGDLPEIEEQEPNNSTHDAHPLLSRTASESDASDSDASGSISSNVQRTINGVLQERGDVDCFRIRLGEGQTVVAALDANQRLRSPIDAILQIAGDNGIVLAENHDAVGLDPRLIYTATEDGEYTVRLFAFPSKPSTAIRYHGSKDCIYRLTVTTGPFVSYAAPLAICFRNPMRVTLFGWNLPTDDQRPTELLGGPRLAGRRELEHSEEWSLSDSRLGLVHTPDMAGSPRVRLTDHDTYPVLVDAESDAQTEIDLTLPTSVTGRFSQPDQQHDFLFPLKKQQEVAIAVESVALNSLLTPQLTLTDPNGKTVKEVGQRGQASDAVVSFTADNDGKYRVTLSDRYGHGGFDYFYRLTIRKPRADYRLQCKTDSIVLKPAESVELKVSVKRFSSKDQQIGPIQIQAIDLPPWVDSSVAKSESEGDTSKEVTIHLTSHGMPFRGPIRIRGTSNGSLERLARTPVVDGICFDYLWLTVLNE